MDEADQGRVVIALILVLATITASTVAFVLFYEREPECDCSDGPPDGSECVGLTPGQADALISSGNATTDIVVIDVRTGMEFDTGHVPGALHYDYNADDFWDLLDGLDRNVTYLLYCQDGDRSSDTCSVMGSMGFSDVREITGGFIAWERSGLSVET